MRNLERDVKMIADLQLVHAKFLEFYNGVNAARGLYTDQEILKYADYVPLLADADKLRQIQSWLQVMLDALSDRQPKSA